MMSVPLELLIIALLLIANGVLSMAEIAVVSSRKTRLRKLAGQGDHRAEAALAAAEEPTRFLSTIQVGITLLGVGAGAFGGRTLAENLREIFATWPAVSAYAKELGIAAVVCGITIVSVVIGELVPKRLGLHAPSAWPWRWFARLAGSRWWWRQSRMC
jgi:putative hemolysin